MATYEDVQSFGREHGLHVYQSESNAAIVCRKFIQPPYHREISIGFTAQKIATTPRDELMAELTKKLYEQ